MSVKILLADDHRMMREALRFFLDTNQGNGIEVVGDVGNGREVLAKAEETSPDIVLMNVDMPGITGVEATEKLIKKKMGIKVIGISSHPDKHKVMAMLQAGALGYLIKSESSDELFRAIHTVKNGQTYLCPMVFSVMAESPKKLCKDYKPKLAPREREVLSLLAQGLPSPAIGRRLSIAPSTVQVHRRNIMRKIGLRGIAELTKYAIREGLAKA